VKDVLVYFDVNDQPYIDEIPGLIAIYDYPGNVKAIDPSEWGCLLVQNNRIRFMSKRMNNG
jgi:hypothetical protein